MPCPPNYQRAGEDVGSTFLHLLDALAKEYELLQGENARLVATIAKDSSPSLNLKEVQCVLDSPDASRTLILSHHPSNEASFDQQVSCDQELSAEQLLPVNHEESTRIMDHAVGNRASRSSLQHQEMHFEMGSRWKERPDLIHQVLVPSQTATVKELKDEKSEKRGSTPLAIHPESHARHFWIIGCVLLLMLDLIWVPIDICFDVAETPASKTIHYIAMIWWTLDIPMTFLTGVVFVTHVELRLRHLARLYAKSWLCFDILLVLPDWVQVVFQQSLDEELPATHISILRTVRWGRFMRLMRMARISKVAKLKPLIRGVAVRYHLSRMYVEVTRGTLGFICLVVVWMHIQSCLWHGFGTLFEDGWIQANNLGSASNGRLYTVSLHWSCSRLVGSNSGYGLNTMPELLVDTLLMFSNLLSGAFLLASITVLTITRTQSKPFNLWKSSVAYSIRHDLSADLEGRVAKWLEVSDFGNVGEIYEEEQNFLCVVPESLRQDLLFETLVAFLAHKQFIKDMLSINERAARHLCYEAITEAVLAPHEVIFDQGDAGQAMRFFSHGRFAYAISKLNDIDEYFDLQCGESISEAVLWTNWEHIGQLRAIEDPRILTLDHDLFASTVAHHTGSLNHAVRYAKHFVRKLNQKVPHVHDLTRFEGLDLEFLNDNVFDASAEKHFIFVSHYKVEAGTEATLMFDRLKDLLMAKTEHVGNNLLRPVFIDSENLTDLARLTEHVKKSAILLLLLTPGVLSRPWCLIEIATAIKHSVSIVLVDIQRPGSKFQYPDDGFYEHFLAGRTLEPQSVGLLESEGITLESVEKSLRRIFCKISLPFSPHRSEEVREAELQDILKRCDFEFSQNPRSDEW